MTTQTSSMFDTSASTEELLLALKAGRDEALDILYPRFARPFYRFARRRGLTHEESEDAVHDTFMRAVTKIHNYDPARHGPGGADAYLWQIHRHVVFEALAARRNTITLDDGDETNPLPDSNQIDPDTEVALRDCLQTAWNGLTNVDRARILHWSASPPTQGRRPGAVGRFKAAFKACYDVDDEKRNEA